MTVTTCSTTMATLLLMLVVGCGDKKKSDGDGAASCKPLSATIDGKPVADVSHGLGFVQKGDYSIYVFNHDKVTCEQLLAPSRTSSSDEVFISAGLSSYGPAVAYNTTAKLGPGVEVKLTTKPAKPGDRMAMCVKATVPFKSGEHAGKSMLIEGLLAGSFCGERK